MSLGALMTAAAGVVAAAVAAGSLWQAARHEAGRLRHAYWWFSIAAGLACVTVVTAALVPVSADAAPPVLSLTDLPALIQLPVMAAGLVSLASVGTMGADPPLVPGHFRRSLLTLGTDLVDGYLLAAGLFLIQWVSLFGPVFARSGVGPGGFAQALLRPLADLVFVGALLGAAGAAGRRGLLPYLALLAMSTADALSVGARLAATHPGGGALAAQLVALGLLGLTPWAAGWWPTGKRRGPGSGVVTVAAGLAGGAGLAVTLAAVVSGRADQRQPVVLLALGATIALLALRVVGLARRPDSWARVWQESGREFRQLAERTSDVVLLCDPAGVVRYASRAVGDYGYTPDSLRGRQLMDFVHPEDRAAGLRAVAKAADPLQRAGPHTYRVRGADGTWRYVEARVSNYRNPGGPRQLLVTARDLSAQVALRRQVAHLTFHDGLTGLPNRAYVEQRARDILRQGPAAAMTGDGRVGGSRAPAAVMVLDMDGFTACNEAVGRVAGDLLLSQVARRLRLAVSPQDTVARWGGDEFAVLVETATNVEEVTEAAKRLARVVDAAPFQVGDAELSLTASVGVAVADGGPAGQVWRHAESAMTTAKEAGGGRVVVFGAAAGDAAGPPGTGVSQCETRLSSG
ncbi:MAG TPA: sensor domain-containing diguanylate cyclase [Streptosporangiaceae bacterium]|nr:sensor domain-containing diguanylate cyclase [Streptosporangiaceae bacterium]